LLRGDGVAGDGRGGSGAASTRSFLLAATVSGAVFVSADRDFGGGLFSRFSSSNLAAASNLDAPDWASAAGADDDGFGGADELCVPSPEIGTIGAIPISVPFLVGPGLAAGAGRDETRTEGGRDVGLGRSDPGG